MRHDTSLREPVAVTDVSGLRDYAFGTSTISWWGVMGFILIEGTAFVLAIGAYYYLLHNETAWPPSSSPPPLMWATIVTAALVLTEIPNTWLGRKAMQQDATAVRRGLLLMTVLGVATLVLRAFEMDAMNVRWDRTAYGSIVWALIVLHTLHAITDVFDTGVLASLAWSKPIGGRKHSDVCDNAMYWHFIVWSWVAIYVVIYWTPRWL
ncbi:cytochrome c oxidase subunit 3 [Lysobacter arvi]|uniref:cytochrome-c oxidase n=1 Tax=Lysobacter arvi TaxID=3038776 RepID=A0ABU1CAD2_9GAMM|nr:cytochrome c oxidase subunit 3 [Lysobacter arvi]MDR0182148.1 cytochrome c oxidase subunit 3 [Lysobacter arvi]